MANISNTLIDAVAIGNKDATIATVAFVINDEIFSVDGVSKRDPQDPDNAEIAELLAFGRAFELLGAKLLKRANGLIKHQDDIREYKEIQKIKKVKAVKKAAKRPAKTLKALASR